MLGALAGTMVAFGRRGVQVGTANGVPVGAVEGSVLGGSPVMGGGSPVMGPGSAP
jgi:hypothetical protein